MSMFKRTRYAKKDQNKVNGVSAKVYYITLDCRYVGVEGLQAMQGR